MKNAILLVMTILACANASSSPEHDIIQKRQVQASSLRNGTRRFSARQLGGASPAPSIPVIPVSPYLNCPEPKSGFDFVEEEVKHSIHNNDDKDHTVRCRYLAGSGSGDNYACTFASTDGKLVMESSNSAIDSCPSSVPVAPSFGEFCFNDCPRRMNGFYLADSLIQSYEGTADIYCSYSLQEFSDQGLRTCQYSAVNGLYTGGASAFACSLTVPKSKYCGTLAGQRG